MSAAQPPKQFPKQVQYLQHALALARAAGQAGEVPVGAVLYGPDGTLIASAANRSEELRDPTAHAEMLALRAAIAPLDGRPDRRYFEDCTLAVTLEPCAMCLGALCAARVGTILFGAYDEKSGGTVNGARVADHAHFRPQILGGLEEEPCRALLQQFFQSLRTPS